MTTSEMPTTPVPVASGAPETNGTAPTTAERLARLREPFPAETVGKLPATPKRPIELDYVGHAAVTDRLLSIDPEWSWEPFALDADGLPAYDRAGGLWIRLTICGVTRIGYGDGPDPKQRIGDAIRNAGMRFGIALYLWGKDELESLIGNEVIAESRKRKPPRGSTAVERPTGNRRIQPDPATAGIDFASAKDRNRLIGYAARQLDPPVIEKEAVNAWVGTLIGHEIDDIVHLTAADCLVAYSKLGLEPA